MSTIGQIATDVILRDGSTLRLRQPGAEDAEAVLQFFESLSDRSRYLRFHGFPALEPKLVTPFLDPDWEERRDELRLERRERSEEHTSELQSLAYLVCRLL